MKHLLRYFLLLISFGGLFSRISSEDLSLFQAKELIRNTALTELESHNLRNSNDIDAMLDADTFNRLRNQIDTITFNTLCDLGNDNKVNTYKPNPKTTTYKKYTLPNELIINSRIREERESLHKEPLVIKVQKGDSVIDQDTAKEYATKATQRFIAQEKARQITEELFNQESLTSTRTNILDKISDSVVQQNNDLDQANLRISVQNKINEFKSKRIVTTNSWSSKFSHPITSLTSLVKKGSEKLLNYAFKGHSKKETIIKAEKYLDHESIYEYETPIIYINALQQQDGWSCAAHALYNSFQVNAWVKFAQDAHKTFLKDIHHYYHETNYSYKNFINFYKNHIVSTRSPECCIFKDPKSHLLCKNPFYAAENYFEFEEVRQVANALPHYHILWQYDDLIRIEGQKFAQEYQNILNDDPNFESINSEKYVKAQISKESIKRLNERTEIRLADIINNYRENLTNNTAPMHFFCLQQTPTEHWSLVSIFSLDGENLQMSAMNSSEHNNSMFVSYLSKISNISYNEKNRLTLDSESSSATDSDTDDED